MNLKQFVVNTPEVHATTFFVIPLSVEYSHLAKLISVAVNSNFETLEV